MKRYFSLILALAVCVSAAAVFSGCSSGYEGEINVYNWGEYISDGSEDYVDVIEQFEEEYNIKVNYTTYETNEELFNILSSSNSSYDVVIPSDYMIEKLIKADLLQKLDYSNIPNYEDVMDKFKGLSFDPENEYSVPYQWGVVGIVYNKEMVKEKPDSWEDLWDSGLSGSILQFNNSRDAYAIAMQLCGIDPSTFTEEDVDKATVKLKEQKPLLKKYVMDQVFAEMENNQSAIAPYYAGDIRSMMNNNEKLDCALPKEGSNLYVDAMCIPKCAQNKEDAEKFINFMTSAEISKANSEYIGYATPVQGAYDLLGDKVKSNTFIYPTDEYLEKCYTFRDVDNKTYAYMQEQFVKLMS